METLSDAADHLNTLLFVPGYWACDERGSMWILEYGTYEYGIWKTNMELEVMSLDYRIECVKKYTTLASP